VKFPRATYRAPRKLIYASAIDARNVPCYRKDEDRPLGFALQDVIPNHHKLLWSKATVVSVMEKAKLDFVRCVLRRRTQ
jgi:hypothetical protein